MRKTKGLVSSGPLCCIFNRHLFRPQVHLFRPLVHLFRQVFGALDTNMHALHRWPKQRVVPFVYLVSPLTLSFAIIIVVFQFAIFF